MNRYLKLLGIFLSAILLLIGFAYITGRVPDIMDEDIHPVTTAHIDTAAFNDGQYQFPEAGWKLYGHPGELGWSESKLAKLGARADSLETAALMVIHKGVLVNDWGATDEPYITQSIRKGLLNSLYGIYRERGDIDIDKTLAELGINDTPPLTPSEQQATVRHLLQSTSGVYHSALYEVGSWKRNKPERGTHQPGESWYYNNWDFNALGTIFEQETGREIGPAFYDDVAQPIQMQDFNPGDVVYSRKGDLSEKIMDNTSDHPAYMFSMSARDLARYGLLYLNKGRWGDRQVVPEQWIAESWEPVDISIFKTLKFGYLWWQFEDGYVYPDDNLGFEDTIYFTSGNRGHLLFVIPYLDLVVVHRVYTKGINFWSQMNRGLFGNYAEVDRDEIFRMLELIREAHPKYQ